MYSGTGYGLYGVWGSSGSDVFAVGGAGTIVHYDGMAWSAMDSGTGRRVLREVSATKGKDRCDRVECGIVGSGSG